VAALAYIICALVWGTTWFAIRVCIAPGGYPEFAAAALRFSIASVILLAIWALGFARPGPRTRRQLAWMLAAGVANGGSYALIFSAERHIPGGLTAVLFGTFPLVVAILAFATRTERIHRAAVIGSLISVAGIAIVFSDRLRVSAEQAWAVAMVLVAVVLSAIYSVIVKREAKDQHPLATTGAFLATTAVVLWIVSAFADARAIPTTLPYEPTVALLYLGVIGSVLVFGAYFTLMKRVSLMTISTLVFLQPMIALVVDALWEHEVRLDLTAYLGGAVVLAGVAINVFSTAKRQRAL
jgi:drug/metabolite transporter (DMT)-like permease